MQKFKILWYKLRAKVISSVVNIFAKQTNFDVENTVLIIGSARSGTTFLMESLNSNNDYRIIFEPFNPTYTKEWSQFSARQYIDPNNVKEVERQAVDNILRGNINNQWVNQYNRKLRSKKRLIKSVRANLMLDFFASEYPDLQIIYLYRNPYDVVASRINLNFDPKDVFLVLEHAEFIKKYYSDINLATLKTMLNTPESCHVALWCFENRYLLQDLENRNLMVAKYEEIIGKSVNLEETRLQISNKIRKPSVTSSLQKSYLLSEQENAKVAQILAFFGMEKF